MTTAEFVLQCAGAQYHSTTEWTFTDLCGIKHPIREFLEMVIGVMVKGEHTTVLTIRNLNIELYGWAVFCRLLKPSC